MSDETPELDDQPDSLIWAWGLVESAVDGIVTIGEQGLIEYMNPAACTMFGYVPEEVMGQNIKMLMPNPYRIEHDDYLRNYMRTGLQKVIGIGREVVGLRKDLSTFPMHLSVSEVEVEGRRRFTGVLHDITPQRTAQQEKDRLLQELNWRNKELNCLYRIGELLRGSDLSEEVLKEIVQILDSTLSESDVTGTRLSIDETSCCSPLFQSTPWALRVDIRSEGRKRGNLEVCLIQDANAGPEEARGHVEDRQSLLQALARLMGEALAHQEAEAKVLHASKLASIGELAAGMGHEINNPVNGIINCADILLKEAEPNSKTAEFSELIRSEAERIATIVRDLLTFSRQDTSMFSAARVSDIIETVLTLSSKTIEKSHITLHKDIPESLPRLECRSEQLQQVLMNLILNAIHALDNKYDGPSKDKLLVIAAEERNIDGVEFVRLSVTDHGTGISPTHLERIYDPFFTTKGRDLGTGLGLSVSDGIIKNHHGTIAVDTQLGKYTTFNVDIPVYLNREEK